LFYLYYIQEPLIAFDESTLLSTLPASRRDRIARRPWADRIASAAAAHLLRYALCDCGYAAYADAQMIWEGKPHFADPAIPVHFNLSHTVDKARGMFAAAVLLSDGGAVGTDIEVLHALHNHDALVRRLFTDAERDYVLSSEREDAFFELWCAKEAYLKWTGAGFSCPMSSVSVDVRGRTARSDAGTCDLRWFCTGDAVLCAAGTGLPAELAVCRVLADDVIHRTQKNPNREESDMEPIMVNEHLLIRELRAEDVQPLVDGEIAQGWHATPAKLEMRLAHAKDGRAVAFAAVWDGIPVGYVSVYDGAIHGPYAGCGYPEIVDFNVLERYRQRGIGSALLDVCEAFARETSDIVTLGVGLHCGYGAAQRLYVKRGYVPDGSGVWSENVTAEPYTMVENGDGLVLYMAKQLK